MTTKTSLAHAIKNSPFALGDHFELLGEKKGFFKGRTYLSWNEKSGWKVCHFNFLENFLRFAFGWFEDTHLHYVASKIELEPNVDPILKNRIENLWKKTYPQKNLPFTNAAKIINSKAFEPLIPPATQKNIPPEIEPAKAEIKPKGKQAEVKEEVKAQSKKAPEPGIVQDLKPQPKIELPKSASPGVPPSTPTAEIPKASSKSEPKTPVQKSVPKTANPSRTHKLFRQG